MTGPTVDVAELARLLEAATPGPWWVWDRGVGYHLAVEDPDGETSRGYGRPKLLPEGDRTDLGRRTDADLIVAAVNALPALLDLIRRQDAALTAVRELADEYEDAATFDHQQGCTTGGDLIRGIRAALASPDTTQEATP